MTTPMRRSIQVPQTSNEMESIAIAMGSSSTMMAMGLTGKKTAGTTATMRMTQSIQTRKNPGMTVSIRTATMPATMTPMETVTIATPTVEMTVTIRMPPFIRVLRIIIMTASTTTAMARMTMTVMETALKPIGTEVPIAMIPTLRSTRAQPRHGTTG